VSEDRTRGLPDNRSFEERVFARFDVMDARFDAMEGRFDGLDTRVQALEARALDTKPIWERALAEIHEVKQGVDEVKERVESIERKFDVLTLDMMQLRGDQRRADKRMDALESRSQ
jgi:chromosome segregation ATPase